MTVFFLLIASLSAFADYPVVDYLEFQGIESISQLPREERSALLFQMEESYLQYDNGSGPFTGSFVSPGGSGLVLVEVYRSLTPGDLELLDRAGLWPAGYSPQPDAFVAVRNGEFDPDVLTGSGFVRRISDWTFSDAASGDIQWNGPWLVQTATGFLPENGVPLADDWWSVPSPPENGALRAIPDVYVSASNHALNTQADDSRELSGFPGLWSYYTGLGIRVGVLDTGIWSEHPDLLGAVYSGPPDQDGHGTAVCGVIAARGETDLGCEHNGSGGAPDAQLYVIQRPSSMTPSQLAGFFGDFSSNSCSIVNNSWGFQGSTSYDGFCQIVDQWVRSGGITVFSAGNDPDPESITSPGIARNAITVGAVTFIPDNGENCVLASYSGRGPTEDGRMKPEILAPGGEYYQSTMQYGVATTNAFYGGSWLDDPADRWPGEASYTRRTGTSMSAAFVTAALALCQEKYGTLFHPEDAFALIAACAIPLKGSAGTAETGYADSEHGFGLLDGYHLPGTYFSEEVDRPLWINSNIVEGQPAREWVMYVPAYTSWISTGLGYSDVSSASPELQVDLDLTLVSPSNVIYSYSLPAGVTAESPVERVVVENPEPGAWSVRVEAESWADPGDPSEDQQFTVVTYRYSRDPELSVTFPSDTVIYAPPGGELTIPVSVANTGGYIAAGAWVLLDPPDVFTGDVNIPSFLGNLVYKNSSASAEFTLECPNEPGTHVVNVIAGAANRGLDDTQGQFTILLAYPDLSVSIPSPDIPPPFSVGQTTGFSTVVSNDGEGPSPATRLVYYLTTDPDSLSEPVVTFDVPPLESGETASFKGGYRFTYFDIGRRYMVAVVDPDSTVTEQEETNNRSAFGPFTVTGEYAPPQNLVAVSGNNGFIPLSWEPPEAAAGSKGLSSYRIYRSVSPLAPEPEPITELGTDTLEWTDSLVVNGIGYYYWATCVYSDPGGESTYSNMASATAQGPTGSLGGTVTDIYTGRDLPDMSVSIPGLGITSITDNIGYYYFEDVPVGPVPVVVDQEPYLLFTDTAFVDENVFTDFNIGLVRDFSPGMTVIPTPFTPNGDGINDTAAFVWPAASGAPVDLVLYTIEGIPFREITSAEPIWDGNDNSGQPVPSGVYIFHAAAPQGEVTGTVCVAR